MADNIITSSKKEIYTKLLDIGEKYVNDISGTDFLKTGLFGYITESMAMMIRDSSYYKSMIYNELFLNTAIIPKSVYNWAKMFNVEVQKAVPAYAKINIIINSNTLSSLLFKPSDADKIRYGSAIGDDQCVILNKEDPIIAGDYYFSLEHSILIMKSNNQFVARYITSEYISTDYQNIAGKSVLPIYSDGENIVITARAYQYKLTKIINHVPSSAFLNKIQTYTFEDQFCGAVLFYTENGVKTQVSLKYSDLDTTTEKQAAFYNLTDEHELQLIFKTGDRLFMPSANSSLTLHIYSTKGSGAPSTFTGDAYFMTSDSRIKSLPIVINFNPTNIIGGKNSPTLTEIKRNIIDAISTRNTITTQSDLNNYFAILTSLLDNINNGKIKFIKQRDDIISRLYNAYLLLRDNTNDVTKTTISADSKFLSACVPTNTIDTLITTGSGSGNVLEFQYPVFNMNGNYQQMVSSLGNGSYYICPLAIYIIRQPFRAVKYIYNMTDSSANLVYHNSSNVSSEVGGVDNFYMIPVSIELHRGFAESGFKAADSYILKILTTTNKALDYCSDPDSEIQPTGGTISIKGLTGIVTAVNANSNNVNGPSYKCSSVKNSDNAYNTIIEITLPVNSDSEFNYSGDGSSFTFGNTILLRSDNNNSTNSTTQFNAKEKLTIDLDKMTIGPDNGSKLNLSFESETELVFFSNLDNIMKSDLAISKESDDSSSQQIALKEVPVIHSSFFQGVNYSEERKEGFVSQLFTYIELLKENLEKLETNTFFNLKFYNTYGESRMYDTTNTNLELELYISLKSNYTGIEYNQLRDEIRSYIRKIIDNMNNTIGGFILSSLYQILLAAYGQYIDNIQFLGLNGTFEQVIDKTGVEEDIGYPPEWLNISADTLEKNIKFNVTE